MVERRSARSSRARRTSTSAPVATSAPQSPESRVAALQRELAAAQAQYTDKHPEVQRLRDELAAARREAAAERARPGGRSDVAARSQPHVPAAHGRSRNGAHAASRARSARATTLNGR